MGDLRPGRAGDANARLSRIQQEPPDLLPFLGAWRPGLTSS